MTTTMTQTILERAAALGYPMVIVGDGPIQNEGGWRRYAAMPGLHSTLSQQLDALEREQARRVAIDEAEDQRARDREDGRKEDSEFAADALREAERDLKRYEAERPARTEALLARIANAVEALAKR